MSDHTLRPWTDSLDTLAGHAGREDFAALGVHAPPLDLSSTYPVPDLGSAVESLDAMMAGGEPHGSSVYARLHNPTVARFEGALAKLEGAAQAVAFGSGMAALSACLLAASRRGHHVIAVRPLYGTSDHLLASGMLPIETSFVEPHEVAAALRPDTSLVILETPANPTLALVDIADVVRQAGSVPVLVDSTFATPVLQKPLELGARLVLHSATKFLGGHGDVVAGVVATNEEWATQLRKVRLMTGGLLHPLAAYLLLRSLPTLALRVRAAQAGARFLAERLAEHPAVEKVYYPGFDDCDPDRLVGRQMAGPGSLLAFEVEGGCEAAAKVMAAVRLMTPAVSLGSTDTLIQHPAGLTHRAVPPEVRRAHGITDGLLRLSVGIEDPKDLWDDLAAALEVARGELSHLAARETTPRFEPAHP
ncbi:MAG TPA: PLP-dependent aspartate aminotransferase family protein [Thermoanaerobaculia bacterium]|nr:PLP-dependent aspartate aminotransferase family protein [Thermoanaerobaculia bacterium]